MCLVTLDPHLAEEFTLLQLELYADYDYKQLKTFLIQTIYPLEKAYQIVEKRKVGKAYPSTSCSCSTAHHANMGMQLYPEMVYILGRMGNAKDALDLIIKNIGDVKQVWPHLFFPTCI